MANHTNCSKTMVFQTFQHKRNIRTEKTFHAENNSVKQTCTLSQCAVLKFHSEFSAADIKCDVQSIIEMNSKKQIYLGKQHKTPLVHNNKWHKRLGYVN